MSGKVYTFTAKLWRYASDHASWIFVTIDTAVVGSIRCLNIPRKGWGSLPVEVTLGESTWKTSIFPDKMRGYILPIKAKIRHAEDIDEGDVVDIKIRIIAKYE